MLGTARVAGVGRRGHWENVSDVGELKGEEVEAAGRGGDDTRCVQVVSPNYYIFSKNLRT